MSHVNSFEDLGFVPEETNKKMANAFSDLGFVSESQQQAPQEESWSQYIPRVAAQNASRVVELAGLPQDIIAGAGGLALRGAEAVAGRELPEWRKNLEIQNQLRGPGSSEIKEGINKLTGGYTKARTPGEESFNEFVQDAAINVVMPGGFLRGIGQAAAGQLSKEAVKLFGGSEGKQTAAKIIGSLGASMVKRGGLEEMKEGAYQLAQNIRGPAARIAAPALEDEFHRIGEEIARGFQTPTKETLEEIVKRGLKKFGARSEIEVAELENMKRDLNEIAKSVKVKTGGSKGRLDLHEDLANKIRETMEQYGKTNPGYFEAYMTGDAAHKGMKDIEWMREAIKKQGKKVFPYAGALLFTPISKPVLGGAAALGYAGIRPAAFAAVVAKNPTLQKYYINSLKNASVRNIPGTLRNVRKLDERLAKIAKEKGFEES